MNPGKKWHGMDRSEVAWYPSVDPGRCTGCGICVLTCGNGVFQWEASRHRPVVSHPKSCVVGCTTCAKVCPPDALTFPADPKMFVRGLLIHKKLLTAIRKELDDRLAKFPDHVVGAPSPPATLGDSGP